MSNSLSPVPTALEAAQVAQEHAEVIAEAAQAALIRAKTIAQAALNAQTQAEVVAHAAQLVQAAGIITQAAQTAQAVAESITEAIRVSERRYRRLFETARDGILMLDSETGKITDANPYMAELLGYSQEDFIGKELWEIGLLRDKTASQEAFRLLQQDGYIRYEDLPLKNRRGERREVEFVSNLYREDAHPVIQCNIRDITERRATEQELAAAALKNERIAETLQRSMLQKSPDGQFTSLDVKTFYEAAFHEAQVGGDFFDAFALSSERVALVVGDVSGKGLAAAGRTAEVKYALRAFLYAYESPEIALSHLNGFICETHRQDAENKEAFIVLALAVIDTGTGKTIFSAAGAEPTLILRADATVEPVSIVGLPLGIQLEAAYTAKTRHLGLKETILMATDGITEARRGQTLLGAEGLITLLEKTGPDASLQELNQSIYQGARDFAGGGLHDDVCLLLARRK